MPPKQAKPQRGAKGGEKGAKAKAAGPAEAVAAYDPASDPPVAVIIADSFSSELKPLTQHRPRALLPVGNVPLIEYALELLVVNGIREVRVVTYFGADAIQQHLETTITYTGKTWLNSSEIKVQVVRGSSGIQNLSAALVDVLHKNQLPERFILLPVDTITTCRNLAAMYHTHARRNKASPNMVLTLGVLESATQLRDAHECCIQAAMDAGQVECSPNTNSTVGVSDFNAAVALRPASAAQIRSRRNC